MQAVSKGDVDIQLKVLQAVLVILTIGPVNGGLLGDVRLIFCHVYVRDCSVRRLMTNPPFARQVFRIVFELRDSRIPVVSSTAAASLRQGVMVTFDKIIAEDDALKTGTCSTQGQFAASVPAT